VEVANGRIDVTYGNEANAALHPGGAGLVLGLTPYETPDLSVAWRCGGAPQPAGTALLGTAGAGTTAAYAAGSLAAAATEKYLPKACRA
jgi:hypothetical protein